MKKKRFIKLFLLSLATSVLTVCFLAGCVTYDKAGARTREREDLLLLREDVTHCKGKLETMEIEQQRILNEIQVLRSKGADENTLTRLDELERRIAVMDAARTSDRQAIIDQISDNVARMMSASSPKTTPGIAASSHVGYEHIVKEGETLSIIAEAYKVKSSAIIEANDLKNPNLLRKGQKLFIPQ